MTLLDTNVLIFDALYPEKLSKAAKKILNSELEFSCADISLLELSMLIAKKRIPVDIEPKKFIEAVLASRKIKVLPITPDIAVRSQSLGVKHKDPADLLIAATAICHGICVLSADEVFKSIPGLKCIW